MTGPLAGRGAVVTGGGRGIGAAIAGILAGAGADVVVAARTGDEVERVAESLRAAGGRAWSTSCDVTREGSVHALGETAREHLGSIDILVNNAGGATSAPLTRLTLDEWDRALAVNATGTFLCTREFVLEMIERRWGRVVNVASVAGLEGAKYVAHYSAAKHAVIGFTRSVALELGGTGVTINAVCPAYVDTPMTEHTLAALAAVLASAGQERLVTPGEVAEAVLSLCLDEAGAANGQAVVLGPGVPAAAATRARP